MSLVVTSSQKQTNCLPPWPAALQGTRLAAASSLPASRDAGRQPVGHERAEVHS